MEDLLGWVAILVLSIILYFKPWYFLDPIFSIAISLFIMRNVYRELRKVLPYFLLKFPSYLPMQEIINQIKAIPRVHDVHAIRGLSIDDSQSILSFHIAVDAQESLDNLEHLKIKIREELKKYQIRYSSIEFEKAGLECQPEH